VHLAHSEATPIPTTGGVLVADDDPDVRATLHRVLPEVGYGVCEAKDGVQALAQLWASERRLVALVDDQMPRMTRGAVVLTATEASHLADRHALVLMTADRDRLPRALSILAARCGIPIVCKPLDLDALLAVVAEAA
jgi:CheY-like chemotaxis protein